jgi:hypothetical protein
MPSQPASTDTAPLHWLLRIACAAEFVGHGAFGVMTKATWLPYFGVAGIPPELAWKLMPLIGTVDITLGLVVGLVRPARVFLLYMAFWGLLTATIRPLAGEPIWEFVERVPNWAVPLAFFDLRSMGQPRPEWLRQLGLTPGCSAEDWLLRVAVAGALVGHGACGAILAKTSWFSYFAVLGLSQATVESLGFVHHRRWRGDSAGADRAGIPRTSPARVRCGVEDLHRAAATRRR